MPSVRRQIFGHVMSGVCTKMNRMKKFEGDMMETPLKRCLTTFDITLLGVGHMVGAGIYVLTGTVAHYTAGPGIILSFLIAGFASLLSAFCYAEFGAKMPKAGSAYVYTYVAVGEFWAFVIGWNIILEHMIGAASVARAWSHYVDSLTGHFVDDIKVVVIDAIGAKGIFNSETIPDPVAAGLTIVYAFLLACGVKASATVNSILTVVNLAVMALVIVLGFSYDNPDNWSQENGGFLPLGMGGVLAGAATCFYAFIGFDSIATSGEEAKNPGRSIPLATALSMCIVTVGYVLVSGTLTLMVPYADINPRAALPEAFASNGVHWAKYVISIGALCGMTTTLFGSLYSLSRMMYAMASDGLLFSSMGRVHERTQVPFVNLAVSGGLSALVALIFDLQNLVEFMSIGTSLAYTIVATSVIVLRYRPESVRLSIPQSGAGTPSGAKSPPTEDADSNSDCHSVHSRADTEIFITSGSVCNSCQNFSNLGEMNITPSKLLKVVLADSLSPLAEEDNNVTFFRSFDVKLLDYGDGTGMLRRRSAWLAHVIGNWEPGTAVVTAVIIYTASCVGYNVLAFFGPPDWWTAAFKVYFVLVMCACLVTIEEHQQCLPTGKFRVPLVPLVPAISVFLNISLMCHLSSMTWIRFLFWMLIGMFVYFLYGIHHSKEASGASSYSVLMTSSEAEKASTKWSSVQRKNQQKTDKVPILGSDEFLH